MRRGEQLPAFGLEPFAAQHPIHESWEYVRRIHERA